jgi:hypothetical protein
MSNLPILWNQSIWGWVNNGLLTGLVGPKTSRGDWDWTLVLFKGRHSQFSSAPPQNCRLPNRLWNCGLTVKKLRNCNCGPSMLDSRSSATLWLKPLFHLSHGQFRYLWTLFLSSGLFKNQPKFFRPVWFKGNWKRSETGYRVVWRLDIFYPSIERIL